MKKVADMADAVEKLQVKVTGTQQQLHDQLVKSQVSSL